MLPPSDIHAKQICPPSSSPYPWVSTQRKPNSHAINLGEAGSSEICIAKQSPPLYARQWIIFGIFLIFIFVVVELDPVLNPTYSSISQSIIDVFKSNATDLASQYCGADIPISSEYQPLDGYNIKKVILVSRHGDRSPVHILPDDINTAWDCSSMIEYSFLRDKTPMLKHKEVNDSDPWIGDALVGRKIVKIENDLWKPKMWNGNCLQAELTQKGRLQLIELGLNLRDIYINRLKLLPEKYDPSVIHARSTDIRRTIQSSQSIIEGLYPPSHRPPHPKPINLHTHPIQTDPLHSNKLHIVCPRLARLRKDVEKDPIYKAYLSATSNYLKHVIQIVGPVSDSDNNEFDSATMLENDRVTTVGSFVENLMCRSCWKKKLPCMSATASYDNSSSSNCLDSTDISRLHLYKSFEYYFRHSYFPNSHNPDMIKLEIGPFLHELVTSLRYSPSPPSSTASHSLFHHFSAHDGTLSAILGALQAPVEKHMWPSYRANLIFEVWHPVDRNCTTGEFDTDRIKRPEQKIRVLYNGKPLNTKWCNLGEGCETSTVLSYLKFRIPKSWEQECRLDYAEL